MCDTGSSAEPQDKGKDAKNVATRSGKFVVDEFDGECADCGTGNLDPDLQRDGEDFLLCDECRDKREASPLGNFVIEIEPGNAGMQTVDDVADALHRLANRIGGSGWVGEGKVGDVNGNTVGRWTFHDHN